MSRKDIQVRLCEKCALSFSAKAGECEECGGDLTAPMSSKTAGKKLVRLAREKARREGSIEQEKFGGSPDKGVYIQRTPMHIIVGVIASLVAAGVIALMLICTIDNSGRFDSETIELFVQIDFGVLILLAIAIFSSFFPSVSWQLEHLTSALYYNEDLSPTRFSVVGQQIASIILTLLGITGFAFHLYFMFS